MPLKYGVITLTLMLSAFVLNDCASQKPGYTIMTYNIRHGVGMDRVLDLERTARVIQAANPDFVILNEVDHGTGRAFGILQADSLGKRLDMSAVFGRSIDYDGGEYGNALLSRYPIINFHIIDLSVDSLAEGRSLFISRINLDGDTLIVMGTHLGLSPDERLAQVHRIMDILPHGKPILLCGDFNFEPDSQPYSVIAKKLRDGILNTRSLPQMTFPADSPDRRIDYIFVNDGIDVLSSRQVDHLDVSVASDHLPLILNFK